MLSSLQATLKTWTMWKSHQYSGTILPHRFYHLVCTQLLRLQHCSYLYCFILKWLQVLTMEYVPGIKINKIKALDQLGIDRKRSISSSICYFIHDNCRNWTHYYHWSLMWYRLGRYAVESYLEQILSHGFFHADPVSSNYSLFKPS